MQRHLSWFIACTLLCGLGDAVAQNTDVNFSAQERLDAIRNSLVETALQGATQVRTTQWLDAQGQLRDASSFRSGMEVRGVQVLSYSRDSNGAAKAQLSRPHVRQDLGRSLSDAAQAVDGSCRQAESLRHVMGLTLVFEPSTSPLLQKQVREQIAAQWLAAPDPAWRMVALSAATPVLSTGSQVSLYEQTLIGGHVKSMPWAATLRVSSQPLDGSTWDKLTGRNPRTELALSLTVQGTSGQNKEFQASHSLPLNANETGTASLQNLFSLWGERLGQWIGCDPLQPQVTQRKANLVHINAGGLAGVRAGDEWLLADPKTFPSQVVGPTSSALLLAKVVEVSAHQARLAILAGPAEAVQTHWRAWPAESLNR